MGNIAATVREHRTVVQPGGAHWPPESPGARHRPLPLPSGGRGLQLQQVQPAARRHRGDRQGHPADVRRQ